MTITSAQQEIPIPKILIVAINWLQFNHLHEETFANHSYSNLALGLSSVELDGK